MNSAVADKPRDASVLYAMAWLTPQKTSLATRVIVLTSVLLGQIACASVAALKLGSAGATFPRDGGRGCPHKNTPLLHICYHSESDRRWSNGSILCHF